MSSIATRTAPHKTTREEYPAELLVRDERVQRALQPAHLARLVRELNLDAIGTVVVSRRATGELILLDGSHRVTALLEHGLGEWPVACTVHEGLDLADEARLFLLYNQRAAVKPIEKFRVAVTAEDPTAVALNKLIHKHGFAVGHTANGLHCITALTEIYEGGRGSTHIYPDVVNETLRIIADAWGTERSALKECVLGVGHLLHRYPDLDRGHLITRLGKVKNGAGAVVQRTSYHREMRAVATIREGALLTVREIYNEGLRGARKLT